MVLARMILLAVLLALGGCATMQGYERYAPYEAGQDLIAEHREIFIDDARLSMAYQIAYWDVVPEEIEKTRMVSQIFYVWLRNNTSSPIAIDPGFFVLQTEKGEKISLSSLTQETPAPLEAQTIGAGEVASGDVVFDVPEMILESDKPSQLIYNDRQGTRVARYLQIDDMKKYEGLMLEGPAHYYAPAPYPRRYWYPYYYPYAYYPFTVDFYYFYGFPRHPHFIPPPRRHFPGSAPRTREFNKATPSQPRKKQREFER